MTIGRVELALWAAWLAYWLIAARRAAKAKWKEPLWAQLKHRLPLAVAAYLLLVPARRVGPLAASWLTGPARWLGVPVTAAGLAFAVWARLHLGRNWSAEPQLKEDHRLITSGPYAWARHPIYTGVLGGFAGAAIVNGELRGPVSLALAFAAFLIKSRHEEAALATLFGAEYEDYRRRVKALIPGLF